MADITIAAGKWAIYQAQGTDGGGNPAPLAPGTIVLTIAPIDASRVYVVGIAPDKFAFVPKSPFPGIGSSVTFAFTYAAHDGASNVALATLPLIGQINGAAPAPQVATHLALPFVSEHDLIADPPPADPGTNSATL